MSTPTSIYEKLAKARIDFLAADVKKTGINPTAECEYFELEYNARHKNI